MKGKLAWTDNYIKWFKENTVEKALPNGWTEIATPLMDRHNDGIVIYAKEDRGQIILSDDGYILSDMEMNGVSVSKRMKTIEQFMLGYGVHIVNKRELQITAAPNTYPVKQHLLLQAMIGASDMFIPSKARNPNIFVDDIVKFLDENDIAYTQDIQFQGYSGLIHKVDFIIPKRKSYPERLIYAINTPNKANTKMTLFNWNDIQKVRGADSQMFAFLNDAKKVPEEVLSAFPAYSAIPVLWAERQNYLEKMAV